MGVWTIVLAALAAPAVPAAEQPFTVALDPGHGGTNLGAKSTRDATYEKHVTLEIARRVRRRLGAERGIRVVLCRDSDVQLPVRTRVKCANDAGARLFISLHANASPHGPSRGTQRGFELYVLPPKDVDVDAAEAVLLAPSDSDAAWAGHRVRATARESLSAARRIAWRLGDALGTELDRGIKQTGAASLDVLQGVRMPAVLVEVGFLDHPEEGAYLLSAEGCETIARAIAAAVVDLRAREQRARKDPQITQGSVP